MTLHIVNIKPSKFDDDCMEVTLRIMPSRIEQLIGREEQLVTYKGQGNDWYSATCFSPAPGKIAKFLKAINRGWEFRHIQFDYKRKLRKAS